VVGNELDGRSRYATRLLNSVTVLNADDDDDDDEENDEENEFDDVQLVIGAVRLGPSARRWHPQFRPVPIVNHAEIRALCTSRPSICIMNRRCVNPAKPMKVFT
jgi:hypothetical protein